MPLHEYVVNMHMHTPYSDGEWYHADIAQAALRAGLDMICVTDHNVWVQGPERYYREGERQVLLLVGEEVHDQTRQPQKNHLLVYNANRELARYAPNPQGLIDAAGAAGALTFLAHPHDYDIGMLHYDNISWVDWGVTGYTGLEIWNYMSSFAGLLSSRSAAIRYAFNPELGMCGPNPLTLAKWDALLAAGQRVVGIGNSDAHGTEYSLWGLKRRLFPYEFLFRQVNTHVLLSDPLSGEALADRAALLAALARASAFVGYDGIASTRGFRFVCHVDRSSHGMGETVENRAGITLQVVTPAPATIRILRNGIEVGKWSAQSGATQIVPAGDRGAYRAEAWLPYKGQLRGWIFSNPIYVE
jgi:hypothetical protein